MTTQAPQPTSSAALEQVFQSAVAQQQAGQLQRAAELYGTILQQNPKHAEASFALGTIAAQLHMPTTALPLFMAAVEVDPACSRYWISSLETLMLMGQPDEARRMLTRARQNGLRGGDLDAFEQRLKVAAPLSTAGPHPVAHPTPQEFNALMTLYRNGRYAEAEVQARALTQRYPQHGQSWMVLGAVLKNQGRSAEAIEPMQHATGLLPNDVNAFNNLGGALTDVGRIAEAETVLRRALAINSTHAQALNNLGTTLLASGKFAEAEVNLRRAIAADPKMTDAYNNLGNALKALGRLDDAVASYRRATQLNPKFAGAHYNLGIVLQDLGNLTAAEACYRRALELRPDFAAAYNNLGVCLMRLGRLDEAETQCRRALQLDPNFADAYVNLGATLMSQGRQTDAEACYRQALELNPNHVLAHSNLGVALQDLGRLDDAENSFRRALEINPEYRDALNNLLFVQNYHPEKSAEDIFQVYREFGARFDVPAAQIAPHTNDRNAQRRLKVGYVSPDFRKHSALYFVEPLLAHHDKNAVEVFAYVDLSREDALTPRFKKHVDHWIAAQGLSDDELAARIRADGIDILVDHSGHGNGNRLRMFGRKPAPVSVTWLGCNFTTGMSTVDYYLTNHQSAPPGTEKYFSELPWRMDGPHYVYAPADDMGEVSALPALSTGHVTFGTLTRAIRVNPRTIRVWAEILTRVAGAQLIIDSHDYRAAPAQEMLAAKFAAYGIARERLQIGYHSPPWDVLRRMDIGLDCFPHNSGTTLYESLYMGVPYITLASRPSLGRLGSSILTDAGHPEWSASSEDEYVEIAVKLAADLPRLASLRAELRPQMQSGPLMDAAAYTRRVEAAYRAMFARWAQEHPA